MVVNSSTYGWDGAFFDTLVLFGIWCHVDCDLSGQNSSYRKLFHERLWWGGGFKKSPLYKDKSNPDIYMGNFVSVDAHMDLFYHGNADWIFDRSG